MYEDNNGSAFPLGVTAMQTASDNGSASLGAPIVSRTILGFAIVISCALALMPLLVRPTPVDRDPMEHAVAGATLRVEDLRAAQAPLASYIALAAVR